MTAPALTLFEIVDGQLQPLVFDEPTARAIDPITSHQAAAAVAPRATSFRALALVALAAAGHDGLNDFELAERVSRRRPVGQTSIGVRRKELVTAGLVEATDRTRPSTTGTPALVWRITERGALEARRLAHEIRDDR